MSEAWSVVVLPAAASLFYAVAVLLLKRSSDLGTNVWQTTFICNCMSAVCYCFLWGFGGKVIAWTEIWQPALIALLLMGGMSFQFLAIDRGDVSVAVPVMGLKVLVVAFLTPWLTSEAYEAGLWGAALCSVLGIVLLHWQRGERSVRAWRVSLLAGGAASICFGLFDLLVQRWGPDWGMGRLLPCIFGINAIFTLALGMIFPLSWKSMPQGAWKWTLSGAILLSLQSILFVSCLAIYGRATSSNIIYSSRGLMSLFLVLMLGHWFYSQEQKLGWKVKATRMVGAVLILCAILWTVVMK